MNTTELNKYYQDTFSLVRTMVIKIDEVARRDNLMLEKAGYSVSSDKTTWRYYMNLNGDYHQTDDVMIIQSIDTGEDIIFNKENLAINTITKREYSKGGYWYNRLLEEYPHQSTLITGILSPIPYSETITASNYKILKYNENLVLWNEDQLIPKLQKYINSITQTLFGSEYLVTDNLFLPLMVEKLYGDIISAIHTIRIEDVFSRHTHEFFIWSHINSYGDFTQYKPFLTRSQTMWLFRNIAWITNNPGRQHTFNKLLYNLLSVANIPLAKYDMVSSTEDQLKDLKPTPLYRRQTLNLQEDYGRLSTFSNTRELILKQQSIVRGNSAQTAFYFNDAVTKGETSLHSELPTKVLESSMLDFTNKHSDTLMSVVLNEWIYLAANNIFKGSVIVSDPKTGKQLRISVGDGYNLWVYLLLYSKGERPKDICPARYSRVLKLRPPTYVELTEVAGEDFSSPRIITDILERWFPVAEFNAPDYLVQYSAEVYKLIWEYKKLFSQFYDLNQRARIKHACNRMFDSGIVTLGEINNYEDLTTHYNIDLVEYSIEECRGFAWEIFKRITGWDTNAQPSMAAKQTNLINLMMQLSSYTIHTLKQIEDGTDTIELINETFVGDSSLVGVGHKLTGDFTNVQVDTKTDLLLSGSLTTNTQLPNLDLINPKLSSSGLIKLTDNSVITPVNLSTDLGSYATRLTNNDYIYLPPE